MSIVHTTECIICYRDYDTKSRRPCAGTCGHTICENCKHQMVSTRCPQCNREGAFATTIFNYQVLELIKHFKSMKESEASSHSTVLPYQGKCCECTFQCWKLRLCITCSLKSGLLVGNVHEFVVNTGNNNAEDLFQKAKNTAICADCEIDGSTHQGHKTMRLAEYEDALEEQRKIMKRLGTLKTKWDNVFEKLNKNFNPNVSVAQELEEILDKLKIDIEEIEFLEMNECASIDPVLVADREQAPRDPPQIGLFNPIDNVWTPVVRMPHSKSNYAVANHKSDIFIIGGMNNKIPLKSVEMYDSRMNFRRSCNPMRRPRSRPSACFYNHKLYVAGGCDKDYLKSVEIFDPQSGKWCGAPPLQKPRADASMVACNGELFVLGGFNGTNYEEAIEKLNQTQKFEVSASMDVGRAGFGACAFRGRIYIAGGWSKEGNALRSVRSFDPKTKTWRVEPSMHKERKYLTLHVINDAIYAIRGCADNWKLIEEIEKFDPNQIKWEVING